MKANKALGQNFLTNPEIAKEFVEITNPRKGDHYLEIGPGKGSITSILLSYDVQITGIEIDQNLVNHLNQHFNVSRLTIINKNILNLDLTTIQGPYKVVGALPYNISKKIIYKFITEEVNPPQSLTFIIQKEVADKYTGIPPKSTFLSNFIKIYADCKIIFDIPNENFNPIPKVTSSVIQIQPLAPSIKNHKEFSKFLKQIFLNPRKTIRNNMKSMLGKDRLDMFIKKENRPQLLDKRPGQLEYDELNRLFLMYNDFRTHEEKPEITTPIQITN